MNVRANAPLRTYGALRYHVHPDVYEPADDSWLLVDAVRAERGLAGRTVVEIGCGAGLAVVEAARLRARGIGLDRNPAALRLLADNARLNGVRVAAVRADLVAAIDPGRVDLILFNPPYLPTADGDHVAGALDWAFDGGPSGNEVVLRFLDQLAEWRAMGQSLPPLLIVTSSLNDRAALHARLVELGFGPPEPRGETRFPFEVLFVERFTPVAA